MSTDVTVIDSREESLASQLRQIWKYRELLILLVKRDLNGRYRAASFGRLWIVLRPALEIMTYVIVFGYVLGVRTSEMPYALFLCCGLVPWMFMSQCVSSAADSLAGARHIMSKVHFPRLIVPLGNTALALIDFLVLFAVVLIVAAVLRMPFGAPLLALPFFILLMLGLAFGGSLLVATWSVSHPDVTIGVPLVLRILMYMSPIVYPSTLVPEPYRWLYDLNPIATIVGGFRWSIGGMAPPSAAMILVCTVCVAIVLLAGLLSFVRTERRMIDFL